MRLFNNIKDTIKDTTEGIIKKENRLLFLQSLLVFCIAMKFIEKDLIGHTIGLIVYLGIYLVLSTKIWKNGWLLKKYIVITISAITALSFVDFDNTKDMILENINIDIISFFEWLLAIVIFCREIYIWPCSDFNKKDEKRLFFKQEKDVERIKGYLAGNCNILGIEASWGNGKTFLLQKLKNDFNDRDYEFLEVDVIAYNIDSLPQVLVKEIEGILYKNGVMSRYSNRVKDFFSKETKISFLGNLIFGKTETYSNVFSGFKEELEKTGKVIIIIYEDLDRICDKDLIKKIFYISEKLSDNMNNKVKIIYQYHFEELKKIGFDRYFLDKYIPHTVRLSHVTMLEIIVDFLERKSISNISAEDFDFINGHSIAFMAEYGNLKVEGLGEV